MLLLVSTTTFVERSVAVTPISPWSQILNETCESASNKLCCAANKFISRFDNWKVEKLDKTQGSNQRLADPCQELSGAVGSQTYTNAVQCFSGKIIKKFFLGQNRAILASKLDFFDRLPSDEFLGWTKMSHSIFLKGLQKIPDKQILSSFQQLRFLVEKQTLLRTEVRLLQIMMLDFQKVSYLYAFFSLFLSISILVCYLAITTYILVNYLITKKQAKRQNKEKKRDQIALKRAKRELARSLLDRSETFNIE